MAICEKDGGGYLNDVAFRGDADFDRGERIGIVGGVIIEKWWEGVVDGGEVYLGCGVESGGD